MNENEKKISLPETILLGLYIGLTDLIGIVLAFFALDDFFIIDISTFPVTQFYFRMKGVKGTADLVSNGLEVIPYVGALPIRTIGLFITIYMANHPEKMEAVSSIAGKGNIKEPLKKAA
jgi:hypothetical protein